MKYTLSIIKEHCDLANATSYRVNYSPEFPEGTGSEISSYKTASLDNLVDKVSNQVKIAEKNGDKILFDLNEHDFSGDEINNFLKAVSD